MRPGTTELANHSFKEVEADLAGRGCHLASPASIGQGEQLPNNKKLNMKIIAGLRIHVKRVIKGI